MNNNEKETEKNGIVLLRLTHLLLMFYTLSYAVAGLCHGIFDVRIVGYLPFDHSNTLYTPKGKAAWTTMVMSFLLFSIGTALYFPRLNNLWDYIVTISFLHIFISATGLPLCFLCFVHLLQKMLPFQCVFFLPFLSFIPSFLTLVSVMLSFPVSGLWWGTLIALVVLQLLFSRAVQFLVNKKFPLQTHVE
eukprot:m.39022 g.39022  ORF g.39022 m.39022 type:complete len:190 (-) comp10257_c0_seq2:194-763(-)